MDLSGSVEEYTGIHEISNIDCANANDYINTYEYTKSSKNSLAPLEYKPTLIEFKDTKLAVEGTPIEPWGIGQHELHSYSGDSFKDARKDYEGVKVNLVKDEVYEYYYFETSNKDSNLLVIKFDTANGSLLNINNIIIPLTEFISYTHLRVIEEDADVERCRSHELRSIPTIGYDILMYNNCSSTTLHNVTMPLIMRAISYFTKEAVAVANAGAVAVAESEEKVDDIVAAESVTEKNVCFIRRIFRCIW